jgi:hypothetical protein
VPDVRSWCLTAAWALLGLAGAHALELYVAIDGEDVWGMAYFADGARARDVPVSLFVEGVALLVVHTDDEGRFRFVAPALSDARIEARTLDGHRAVWDLTAGAWTGPTANEADREAAAATAAAAAKPSAPRVLLGVGALLALTAITTVAWRKKRDG